MIKKGDIFTAYREGFPTENVMATMDYQDGHLLYCVNKNGRSVYVNSNEIGEVLSNIDDLSLK